MTLAAAEFIRRLLLHVLPTGFHRIRYEVHSSPHDLSGYDEPLFPVVDTPSGRIGCAICCDWCAFRPS